MTTREDSTRQATRARLRELVAAARVGDRLPSERDLSVRWGVARMTIRAATDALVAEGLVERRHGSGTYVVPRPFARVLGLTSFTQDMAARGIVAGSRVLEFELVPADAAVAGRLRIPIGDATVRFTRLRFGDGDAMAVETTWMPASLVPGLRPEDLEGSLYELLARRYRIVPGAARSHDRAGRARRRDPAAAHDRARPGVPPAADGRCRRPGPRDHGRRAASTAATSTS